MNAPAPAPSKFRRYTSTKSGFLMADWEIKTGAAAVSLAATWIWVMALFVSTGQAFLNGYVGLFWFTFANVGALILLAPFLHKLHEKIPEGYSMPGYFRDRYGRRSQRALLFQYIGHAIGGFATNVLVGAGLTALITGWSFFWLTVALSLVGFAYTAIAGMKASVLTDQIMYGVIVLCALIVVPVSLHWALSGEGAAMAAAAGSTLSGIEWTGVNDVTFFSPSGWTVFWTFGLPVSIVLLTGPFTEQMYWSRAFAASKRGNGLRIGLYAAALFALVPLTLGFLGFAGATAGIAHDGPIQNVGINVLNAMIESNPIYAALLTPYAAIMVMGIMSSTDSMLNSIGTLAGHDGARGRDDRTSIRRARVAMLAGSLAVIAITNVPEMDLLWLWFFYAALRVGTWVPTMFTLARPEWKVTEQAVFWSMISGFLTGPPLLIYGYVSGNNRFEAIGVIAALVVSVTVLITVGRATRAEPPVPQL